MAEVPSLNDTSKNGETALHFAAQNGSAEICLLLIRQGADPFVRNCNGESALDLASLYGRDICVKVLLDSTKSNLNTLMVTDKLTPLHAASRNGHINTVKLLLRYGMNINVTTVSGTCLHEASLYGKTEVVKLLLENGIDPTIRNSSNQTALDVLNAFTTKTGQEIRSLLVGTLLSSEYINVLGYCFFFYF